MKSTKLLIVTGEMTKDGQIGPAREAFIRGVEEMSKRRGDLAEIIDQLAQKEPQEEIELETCFVELLINVDKARLIAAVKEGPKYETLLVLYVGPVTAPWGHWMLQDGLVAPSDIVPTSAEDPYKIVVATMVPCDDWFLAEKKPGTPLTVCNYDLEESVDPVALGLCDFIDAVCKGLKVTPCSIRRPESMSFLKTTQPSVCVFLDRGCSAMPCLLLIDGFSMLFNVGYGRNPEVCHQLKYIAQLDAALLSHLGYNNILALSCTAQDPETVRINHLFLPSALGVHQDKTGGDPENPFVVDLNNELSKVLSGYKERGTSVSNLGIKAKVGGPVSGVQVKPIQLFHKIGYGSLELITLAPFEDDPDVKKCADDMRKGKYPNECLGSGRPLPTSVSVLLLWKPFNPKMATKRLLYIGPKSQLRKNLPSVVTALYQNQECLKQADYSSSDGIVGVKKPVAPVKKTSSGSTKTSVPAKLNGTSTDSGKKTSSAPPTSSTDKTSRAPPLPTTTEPGKKGPGKVGLDKSPRPATATTTTTTTSTTNVPRSKETMADTKRPNTALSKTKPHETTKTLDGKKTTEGKKTDDTTKTLDGKKTMEGKKTDDTTKTLDGKKTMEGKKQDTKVSETKKGAPKPKVGITKPASKKTRVEKLEEVAKKAAESSETGSRVVAEEAEAEVVVNGAGDDEQSHTDLVTDPLCQEGGGVDPQLVDSGKMVAVGTVECAITEHGEADFCDDTPEEYSAEQMKELGLYDDDEDRSSAPISDKNELDGVDNEMSGTTGPGNMAHLPMEGSFYGKDTFDEVKTQPAVWNEPLGLPPPPPGAVKDSSVAGAPKKASSSSSSSKCATPIHVDCLFVPSDLDKEDLRCLFNQVRFNTAFLQLDKSCDLFRALDMLVEERSVEDGCHEVTIMPSLDDESTLIWIDHNKDRLSGSKIKVGPALSRCSILIGGDQGNDACLGYRCDL